MPKACWRKIAFRLIGLGRPTGRPADSRSFLTNGEAEYRRQARRIHREAAGSAGLHLFQELSTLAEQLKHPLLLRSGLVAPSTDAHIICLESRPLVAVVS